MPWTRFQWRGTIRCTMKAYREGRCAGRHPDHPHPRYTWVNENFESCFFFVLTQERKHPNLKLTLFSHRPTRPFTPWSIARRKVNVGRSICVPPNSLMLISARPQSSTGIDFPSTITYQPSGVYTNLCTRRGRRPKMHSRQVDMLIFNTVAGRPGLPAWAARPLNSLLSPGQRRYRTAASRFAP